MDFYDLDIQYTPKQPSSRNAIIRAIELRFTTVALSRNIVVSDYFPPTSNQTNATSGGNISKKQQKKNFRSLAESALQPLEWSLEELVPLHLRKIAEGRGKKINILTRLNLELGDATVAQLKDFVREFQSKMEHFDLLAVQINNNAELLHFACESMPVDIIYFKIGQNIYLQNKLLKMALHRNIHFEWRMVDLFEDASRRMFISLMLDFVKNCRGPCQSLIMSSGAKSEWDIRSGFSYSSIAEALQVPKHVATKMIREHAAAAVQHGLVRCRTIMGAMMIQRLSNVPGVKEISVITQNTSTATLEVAEKLPEEIKSSVLEKEMNVGSGASAVQALLQLSTPMQCESSVIPDASVSIVEEEKQTPTTKDLKRPSQGQATATNKAKRRKKKGRNSLY